VELFEYTGYRANDETRQKLYTGFDAYMYAADKVLASIGQSDNRFTPLQLCVYASTLANQGNRYAATFMNRVVSSDYTELLEERKPELLSTMEVKDEAYYAYVTGMQQVCSGSSGTAYKIFRDYPIAVAAKTGTAETDKTDRSDNAAFICFAPADDPQIAIAIYGEMAGHGSSLASAAKSILNVYFDVDEIGDMTALENQVS
jgi:penicillin-binding protein 2